MKNLAFSAHELAEFHSLPDEAMLTTRQAAAFLNLSPKTLNWYRPRRRGPSYFKLGTKTVAYRVGDLRSYARRIQVAEA